MCQGIIPIPESWYNYSGNNYSDTTKLAISLGLFHKYYAPFLRQCLQPNPNKLYSTDAIVPTWGMLHPEVGMQSQRLPQVKEHLFQLWKIVRIGLCMYVPSEQKGNWG